MVHFDWSKVEEDEYFVVFVERGIDDGAE